MMKDKIIAYLKYFLLAALIYVPVFSHLDSQPIRIWDESRLALNAYEMFNNGNFVVTHYNGDPDMWNTKPPFVIWCQVFFMRTIGVNELAVRLPSALAALGIIIVLMIFSLRYLKSFWFGFLAVLVLITSPGFIGFHAARTGDYDAMLAFFTGLGYLLYFAYLETRKTKFLYFFFIALSFVVLTKSIAGLIFLPAILLFTLIRKQLIPLLKNKHFYVGAGIFIIATVGYYLLREAYNPGYLEAAYANDMGGRYAEPLDGHKGGFWFYFNNIINDRFTAWYLLVPCGIFLGLSMKDSRMKRLTAFSALMCLTFFIVISLGQTKLPWYDVPLYPFLAILVAVFLYALINLLQNLQWANQHLTVNPLPVILVILVAVNPYSNIVGQTYKIKELNEKDLLFYEMSRYFQDAIDGKVDLHNKVLVFDSYHAHLDFYRNILRDKGIMVDSKHWENLQAGDVVFTHQQNMKDFIHLNYAYEVLKIEDNVVTYRIN